MTRRAEAVDVLVGQRIRAYRLGRNMSQTELGKKVGVSFQQIQKYERGVNRVGGSRLQRIAATLQVPVAALFGGEEDNAAAKTDRMLTEILSKPYAFRLLRAFAGIKSPEQQHALVLLAEELSHSSK